MKLHRIAAALALAGLLAATAQAAVLSISPTPTSWVQGDTFSLDVNVSGLGTEIVSVLDLNIYFDPAVLKGLSYTLGAGLGGAWDDSLSAVAGGSFDMFLFSLTYDPLKTQQQNDDDLALLQTDDSFTLFTLNFEAFGPGISQVSFGNGPNERDVTGRDAAFVPSQFQAACVAVSASGGLPGACTVPEPASYGLVGMALLAAGFARRRLA